MPRGRPRLTQRGKLSKKLERLYKEIEEIRTQLGGKFEDDQIDKLKETTDSRPFIEKGV